MLGAEPEDCRRLPALPFMLRKGRLRTNYGAAACDLLIPIAESMPAILNVSSKWLDPLTSIEAIDPGEAQLLATTVEFSAILVSGDKRAIRAAKVIGGLPEALRGRIAVLEAVLLALCDDLGTESIRHRVAPLLDFDKAVKVSFSTGNPNPRAALLSYCQSLAAEVVPLVLWQPGVKSET